MSKILIIEDEMTIVDLISFNLKREGFEIDAAYDGISGLEKALSGWADLILLDVMLPGMNGFDLLQQLRQESDVPVIMVTAREEERDKVLGIGISSPGPLDCEGGRILNPPRFERWHGVEISKLLSDALNMPAYLEHDVCSLAFHQLEMGQSRNFMLVFVDIGIGAAIMSGGKLLGNSKYFTGELGHTTIRFDGRLCECGNRGCLETYASIPALLEGSEFRDWGDLIDHVDKNPDARRLLDQEAVYLSAGLINLINLIPVDTIYLAGDICYRYELLTQRLQREISAKALAYPAQTTEF